MPRQTVILRQILTPATYQSPDFPVPVGITKATVFIVRENWPELPGVPPDNEVIRVQSWWSPDAGATWIFLGRQGTPGGIDLDRNGQPRPEADFSVDIPEPNNPQRLARVVAEVRIELTSRMDADLLIA